LRRTPPNRRLTTSRNKLSKDELDVLTTGFMTIRDQEQLDDVADWANAVLALLRDERT